MKHTIIAFALYMTSFLGGVFAQPTYCNIPGSGTFHTTASTRYTYSNQANQCQLWNVNYFSTGTVSIEFDGSNDGGVSWTAITAATGSTCTNPATAASCNIMTNTYYQTVSVAVACTGSCSVTGRGYGTGGITAKLGGSGGGEGELRQSRHRALSYRPVARLPISLVQLALLRARLQRLRGLSLLLVLEA